MLCVLKEWVQPVFYLVAILASVCSLWTYSRNSKRERARWLFDLFQHFYEGKEHKEIRALLESGETGFAAEEKDQALLQKLDNYLNFFEFLHFLYVKKILPEKDILKLFAYPIQQIAQNKAVRGYALKPGYGYEGIKDLFEILGYAEGDES